MNFHDLGTFLTASGLLATVLAVWVRFWVERGREFYRSGLMGIVWCSLAILAVLAGIGVAVFRNLPDNATGRVTNEAVGFFIAGLLMAAIAVGESLFNTLARCYGHVRSDEATRRKVDFEKNLMGNPDEGKFWMRLGLMLYPILVAAFLVGGCLWFSCDNFSTCSGGMWFLILWVAPLVLVPIPVLTVWRWISAKPKAEADLNSEPPKA